MEERVDEKEWQEKKCYESDEKKENGERNLMRKNGRVMKVDEIVCREKKWDERELKKESVM